MTSGKSVKVRTRNYIKKGYQPVLNKNLLFHESNKDTFL